MWWSSTPTGFWATLWGTRYGWSPSAIISTSHSWATTVGSRCLPFQHPTLMKSNVKFFCFCSPLSSSTTLPAGHSGAALPLRSARLPLCSLRRPGLELYQGPLLVLQVQSAVGRVASGCFEVPARTCGAPGVTATGHDGEEAGCEVGLWLGQCGFYCCFFLYDL